jgi:hypothetical protein
VAAKLAPQTQFLSLMLGGTIRYQPATATQLCDAISSAFPLRVNRGQGNVRCWPAKIVGAGMAGVNCHILGGPCHGAGERGVVRLAKAGTVLI